MTEQAGHSAPQLSDRQLEPPTKWPYVVLLSCIAMVYCYSGGALPVLGPKLTGYFGITIGQFGVLLAVPTLVSIIPFAVAGPMADRWGTKRMLLVAFLGIAVSFGLCAGGTRLPVFAAGMLMTEFFGSVAYVCFPTYLTRLYPASHRRVFSLVHMITSLPSVVIPLVVGRLITGFPKHFHYVLHAPYALAGALLVLGAIFFRRAPSDAPKANDPAEERPSLKAGLRLLSRPIMLLIVLLAVLHGVSDVVFMKWFPIYATKQFGEALKHPGDVLMLYGLAYVISRGVLALVPERWGQRALLIVPPFLGGGILLVCLLVNSPRLMFWGFPVAAFAWSLEYPTLLSEASRRAPQYVGSLLALITMAMQPFAAGATALVGALISAISQAEPTAPWWMQDLRLAMIISPLGFILFGLIAAVSGLGRRPKPDR